MIYKLVIDRFRYSCRESLKFFETSHQPSIGDIVTVDDTCYTVIQRTFEFTDKVSICVILVEM